MAIRSCAQCGAPQQGDPHAVSWNCRHCGSVNHDETASSRANERLVAGIGAIERGEYPAALSYLEDAIDCGAPSAEALSHAALAAARCADLSNFEAITRKLESFIVRARECGSAADAEFHAVIEKAFSVMAAVSLRAIKHHTDLGDKAYFAYESIDGSLALAARNEEYALAVGSAAFSLKHPSAHPSIREAIAEMVVHCFKCNPAAGDADSLSRAQRALLELRPPAAEASGQREHNAPSTKGGRLRGLVGRAARALTNAVRGTEDRR